MVSNAELFRKIMLLSKDLKISAFRASVPMAPLPLPFEGHKPPFTPDFAGHGKSPFGPAFDGKPAFGEGRPPFGPPAFDKVPCGPMPVGMGRERILVILSDHSEGMRQKALAEEAGINASTASEMISKLEDTGYVVRTADKSDKRATVLKLTDMGAARAEEIRGEHAFFTDRFFGKLSEEEKQTLSDLLDKLMAD